MKTKPQQSLSTLRRSPVRQAAETTFRKTIRPVCLPAPGALGLRLLHLGARPPFWRWLLGLFLSGGLMSALAQGQFGDFAYRSNGTEITITGYTGAGGAVVVPDAIGGLPVRTIGDYAFSDRADLTGVVIPDGVTSIGSYGFLGCTGLTSIEVAAGNAVYRSEDGVLFNRSQTTLIQYPGGKRGSYVIPNSVTSIGQEAFRGCMGLTSVVIPGSVTEIGWETFSGCTGLASVVIPDGVTSIGGGAFSGCTGLTSVVIPDSVTSIGDGAFSGCTGLISVVIPGSVTSIGDGAFYGCPGLTSVAIPNSVTAIGDQVFSGCTNLTNIEVAAGNAVYRSEDGVLFNRSQTTLIQYPGGKRGSYAIPGSVTSLGWGAFSGCTDLTSVIIPNSVTSVEGYTFYGCTGLTNMVIPTGVTSIENGTFSGCTSLTSMVIPTGVTSIGSYAFGDCTGLASVVIPGSVTSIGGGAFSGCTGLTSVIIPNSVTSVEGYTFSGCTGLTNMVIPTGVTSIGSSAFGDCTGLASVVIPNSVSSIGWRAFSGCTGLTSIEVAAGNRVYRSEDGVLFHRSPTTLIRYPGGKMGSYAIPAGVTSIGQEAFSACIGLTSVVIPTSVTSIGQEAFRECMGLTSVVISEGVISIGYSAFSACTGLTSVVIPTSVTSIEGGAFFGCMGLTNVVISEGVTSIGEYAFRGCTGLTNVVIPGSVTSIGNFAFSECTGLTSIEVVAGHAVYRSEDGVLFDRSQTTLIQFPGGKRGSYVIPNSVTSIESAAFFGCTGLTNIEVAAGHAVYRSEDGVLFDRGQTTLIQFPGGKRGSYVIPNSVTSIGDRAFSGCTGLINVVIPTSVISIENGTFSGCTGLTSATFEGNAPRRPESTRGGIFSKVAPGFTVYYYAGRTGFTSPTWRGYPAVMLPAPPDGGGELRVDSFTLQNGQAVLVVTGWPRWTYELQRSADLEAASWPVVLTLGPLAAAGPLELTDPTAPAPQAFYRVRADAP